MITSDFKIFNQFEDCIIVAKPSEEIIFLNFSAEKFFGSIKNFYKIKNYFSIEPYGYIPADSRNQTIIDLVFESKQNFHTVCTYQVTSEDYYTFQISSIRTGDYIIIKFTDVSQKLSYRAMYEELENLKVKYKKLEENSNKTERMREQAQQHALQNALINRVFAKIRTSEDIEELLKSVLYEIHELLGAYKTYFVQSEDKFCTVKLVNSEEYAVDIDKKLLFDEQIMKSLKEFKIFTSACITESLDSDFLLRRGTHRVVIPISDGEKTIGAIIALTV